MSSNKVTKPATSTIIRNLMLELEDLEGDNSISITKLIARAEDKNIACDKVEELLEWLKRDGIIFSTWPGTIKFNR